MRFMGPSLRWPSPTRQLGRFIFGTRPHRGIMVLQRGVESIYLTHELGAVMNRSLLAGMCLLIASCGDPVEPTSFDGTITAVFTVESAFGPTDYTFVVDRDPSSVNLNDP